MATKVRKAYGQKGKKTETAETKPMTKQERRMMKKEQPLYPNRTVVAAPVWRRLLAYIVDATLSVSTSWLMLQGSAIPDMEYVTRIWMLLSGLVIQLWIFGFLPSEYTLGQTLGQKIFGVYVRQVGNKKVLGLWKSMVRGYFYGVLAFPLTIPFELFALMGQLLMRQDTTAQQLQHLPITKKGLTLPRDFLFNVEVFYVPKVKIMEEVVETE